MRVSEGRAGLHAMPSESILEQPQVGQLKDCLKVLKALKALRLLKEKLCLM